MLKVTKKTLGRHSVGRHPARRHTLNCRGRIIDLSRPAVMGILNLTPDSFYAGSRLSGESGSNAAIVDRAGRMLADGATFLDVGGYSTRPGASDISLAEETDRVLPAIEAILGVFPDALLSVDTFRASVGGRP